jgi:hypothetical protein
MDRMRFMMFLSIDGGGDIFQIVSQRVPSLCPSGIVSFNRDLGAIALAQVRQQSIYSEIF